MNHQETLEQMIEAAIGAAQGKWKSFQKYAEVEFKRLAQATAWIEVDYLDDLADAEAQANEETVLKMKKSAKKRADLAFANVKLAAESVVIAAKADAKMAAQDAINAALKVLATAVNKSVGFSLL